MKVTQMPPVHAANLVANSGNTAYGVYVIEPSETHLNEIFSKYKCLIQENAFENDVCKIWAIFTRGRFWLLSIDVAYVYVCVFPSMCQPHVCPRDNWWPVQAKITQFGPKVWNTLFKVDIVLGVDP